MEVEGINTAQRKQQIVDAAIKLFEAKGYQFTTNNDIATEAGISRSTLYRSYKNKLAILIDIFELYFNRFKTRFNSIFALSWPAREKMERLLYEYARFLAENIFIARIIIFEHDQFPNKELNRFEEIERSIVQQFQQLYEKGIRNGELEQYDPKIAALTLIGACNGILLWYRAGGSIDPDQIAKLVVDILAKGYLRRIEVTPYYSSNY